MKIENKNSYNDLLLLRKLFFKDKTPICLKGWTEEVEDFENKIFTPGINNNIFTSFILVNFSNEKVTSFFQNPNCEGVIDFSQQKIKGVQGYYFFNNPDGTMRWIFSKKSKHPVFLNLYNGSGWKAKIFKLASRILFFIGWKKRIASGQFSIFSKKEKTMEHHFEKMSYDDFAIFTGTVGENRKAVIALSEKKKCTHFVKIPLTEPAKELVKNEYQQLQNLSKYSFQYLVFPKTHQIESNIVVSNIRPSNFKKNTSFESLHWKALSEMYTQSVQSLPVSQLSFWKTIDEGIHFLQNQKSVENGLSKNIVGRLQKECEAIFYNTNSASQIKVGIGHGDFTPWNMYLTKSNLHLYDWEMCVTDMPLLFDVFHYFFQKGILIERKEFRDIEYDILMALEMPEGKSLVGEFDLDWKKYYRFYLLYIVCYYLPKYLMQEKLHEQVHWLVGTWRDALGLVEMEVIDASGVEWK